MTTTVNQIIRNVKLYQVLIKNLKVPKQQQLLMQM
jgi:hypothetical protein